MTLNRLPLKLQKAFIELQELYQLEKEYKENILDDTVFTDYKIIKLVKLHDKTRSIRRAIERYLTDIEQNIILQRYVLKMPIKEIMERTGYSKRSVLYHLSSSIEILNKHISMTRDKKKLYLRY